MASVASLVRGSNGYMKFVDYETTYKDNNKEVLRGDMWEFSLTNPPKIVYYPGDTIFKARLNTINVGVNGAVSGFSKRVRGNFEILMRTGQQTSGQLQLAFLDREDQAIEYFIDDWKQKCSDRDTKYSFRKDDLVATGVLNILNNQRIPVRTFTFYNLMIDDGGGDNNGSMDDSSDRGDVSLSMTFEHYKKTFDNLA